MIMVFPQGGGEMRLINELTKQEHQVLMLIAEGKRNAKIAQELCISVRTVEGHLYHIFQKLNVSSRTEAAIYALQTGLLSTPKTSGNTGDSEGIAHYYGS
jgi:DNA-binding NarL/FixJ family response regulator